jgi:hypothetical protein
MGEVSEPKPGPEGVEKLLQMSYQSTSDLFKNMGLYFKDQGAVLQIAERMPYEEGQKLLSLFKSS